MQPGLILLTAIAILQAVPAVAACAEDQIELRGDWGSARFTVEIADDADERAQGLMNRPQMASQDGMLFVYDHAQSVSFWMRNTLIPLDMIFIDPTGTVTRVHSNAVPLDETAIPGGSGVIAVLEVNGGLSEVFGIGPGTQVRHPSFAKDDPVWPCD